MYGLEDPKFTLKCWKTTDNHRRINYIHCTLRVNYFNLWLSHNKRMGFVVIFRVSHHGSVGHKLLWSRFDHVIVFQFSNFYRKVPHWIYYIKDIMCIIIWKKKKVDNFFFCYKWNSKKKTITLNHLRRSNLNRFGNKRITF